MSIFYNTGINNWVLKTNSIIKIFTNFDWTYKHKSHQLELNKKKKILFVKNIIHFFFFVIFTVPTMWMNIKVINKKRSYLNNGSW